MSNKLPKALIINIYHSRFLIGWLLAIHIGAGVTVAVIDVHAGVQLAVWSALMYSGVVALWNHGLRRGARAISALHFEENAWCALRYGRDERWQEGALRACTVYPWLVLASVRPADRRRTENLIIPADAVAPEIFRQARLRLAAWSAAV